MICDGAVRDIGSLANFDDLPVYARHHTPRGPQSRATGAIDGPVAFGGLVVNPGDLILGDEDGLMCLKPDAVTGQIDAAETQLTVEAEWIRQLNQGQSLGQLFGLDND